MPSGSSADALHILVLTDRDWTHPQGGGTGTNLTGPGAPLARLGSPGDRDRVRLPGREARSSATARSTLHRMGGRSTVFPRTIWASARGLVPDADVVLEVINGITFLTPLWLRDAAASRWCTTSTATTTSSELGTAGRAGRDAARDGAAALALPGASRSSWSPRRRAQELAAHGIPARVDRVDYIGVDGNGYEPGVEGRPSRRPLPRPAQALQARGELLLDVLEAVPDAVLEIAGEGDHTRRSRRRSRERGLAERVRLHGFVSEARKRRAAPARLGAPSPRRRRGLVPDGDGGGRMRHAERRAGGRRAARVDRGRRDRPAGDTTRRARGARPRDWCRTSASASASAPARLRARRSSRGSEPPTRKLTCSRASAAGGRRARRGAVRWARSWAPRPAAPRAWRRRSWRATRSRSSSRSHSRACSAPTATARWPRCSRPS